MTLQELERRLLDFAVAVMDVTEALPNAKAGTHIAGQLIRSGTSPVPNYGEARSAVSRKDFIHKVKQRPTGEVSRCLEREEAG